MQVTVVIGAGWGDEGKGLMTDYFAESGSLVCRFNGGAQAGHTVVRDGKRHVFSHYGSGALRGVGTFLTSDFIFNPTLLLRETRDLKPINPILFVDGECFVTTPYDVMINMIVEESRGNQNHGSCGAGIYETIARSKNSAFTLQSYDLSDIRVSSKLTEQKIRSIQIEYVPKRLKELGISEVSQKWKERLESDLVRSMFLDDIVKVSRHIRFTRLSFIANKMTNLNPLIFEGAQGLMLDQNNDAYFPNLTPSNTGVRNVLNQLMGARDTREIDLDVVYCTRAYATRHGAGRFPRHEPGLAYEDATNAPNPWQGSLRFGHLDLDILAKAINADFAQIPTKRFRSVRKGLAITCMDQVGPQVKFWVGDTLCEMDTPLMADIAYDIVGVDIKYQSFGPTANDVIEL